VDVVLVSKLLLGNRGGREWMIEWHVVQLLADRRMVGRLEGARLTGEGRVVIVVDSALHRSEGTKEATEQNEGEKQMS
jgi:hypothetical protein